MTKDDSLLRVCSNVVFFHHGGFLRFSFQHCWHILNMVGFPTPVNLVDHRLTDHCGLGVGVRTKFLHKRDTNERRAMRKFVLTPTSYYFPALLKACNRVTLLVGKE